MAFLPWYLPKSQPDRCRFKLGPRNNSSGLFFIDQKPDTLGAVVGRGVGREHGERSDRPPAVRSGLTGLGEVPARQSGIYAGRVTLGRFGPVSNSPDC